MILITRRRLTLGTSVFLFTCVSLALGGVAHAQEVVDQHTARNGMHSCPTGSFITGVNIGSNLLLCTPGNGVFTNEIVDQNTASHDMHACPTGWAMTGINAGANLLSCVQLIDPPLPPLVDVKTARSGMHACPVGRFTSGIHIGNNLLLCGADIGGWMCTSTGSVTPKYLVTSVIYAPPGNSITNPKSFVDYGQGSTVGVTTSASSSFKSDWSANASACVGMCGGGGGGGGGSGGGGGASGSLTVGVTGDTNSTSTNSHTLDVHQTWAGDLKYPVDPSIVPADGIIDHGKDLIYVLGAPTVGVCVNSPAHTVQYALQVAPNVTPPGFRAEWLNNWSKGIVTTDSVTAKGIADKMGLNATDYASIVAQDPYGKQGMAAVDVTTIDAKRYGGVPDVNGAATQSMEFPYLPGTAGPTLKITNDANSTSTSTSTSSYSVGVSVGVKVNVDIFAFGAGGTGTFTWTNTGSTANSNDANSIASLYLQPPQATYQGSGTLDVYWDTIYRTFLFAFEPINAPIQAQGTVTTPTGAPSANQLVTVYLANGRKLRTYTDAKGNYRIVGKHAANAQIEVASVRKPITLGPTARADFKLAR